MGMYLGGQKVSPIVTVGAEINNQDKTITENGTYTADAGYTGLGEVTVNVPSEQPLITELNVTPTTSAQTIVAPTGTDGYSPVNVAAVTSNIDSNIIAGNIKKDVTILGVTGTLEEGITPTGTINITQNGTVDVTNYANANVNVSGGGGSNGKFLVQVIDYDGTVLKQEHLDTGATFTLPSQPSHTGLIFQSWSSPVTITNDTVTVTDSDITIGATYTTASGLSEFDITLTEVTGLSVILNMNGTKNWGDGTSDTSTTHTYSSAGDYTITCDGNTMTTSSSSGLFGQSSSAVNYYARDVRFGSSVTSIGISAFYQCYSLTNITIPEGVTSIGSQAFSDCRSLISIAVPSSVTSIGNYAFQYCYSLTNITIPEGVTSIGSQAFYWCYSLTNITIPEGVTSIGNDTFYWCYSLTNITIPEGVTSIGSQAFYRCYSISEYDFSNHTAVPTLSNTNAFTNINQICKIKIPASLESQWKAETNWSTYADYIVGV